MLRWFRSQATWMLIIFGALLMAIFGLGPVFDQMTRGIQSAGGVDNTVIGKWRGGDITRFQLDEMRRKHFATQRFLGTLQQSAQKQCEEKGVDFQPLSQPIDEVIVREDAPGFVDEQLIEKVLLAERAKEEGIVVSDGMVEDYLVYSGGQADFTRNDLKQINKAANPNGTSLGDIRQHLKTELMAQQMKRFTYVGIPANPVPTEAAELYARANQNIECEVIPVSIEKYVGQITDEPSRSEASELFERGKYEYADPTGVRPGFRIPRKVNIQYFAVDYDTLLQNEIGKISDEDVQVEYDKLVEAKDPLVMELDISEETESFELNLGDDAETTDEADKTDETEKTGDAPAAAAESEESKEGGDDQSFKVTSQKAVPVSWRQEEKPPVTEGEKVVEAAKETLELLKDPVETTTQETTTTPPAVKVETTQETGEVKPATEAMPAAKAEGLPPVQIETKPAAGATEEMSREPAGDQEVGGLGGLKLAGEDGDEPSAGDAPVKQKAKPLADVADKIREKLARKPVFDKREKAMKRAQLTLENYQTDYLRWETSGSKPEDKPVIPDFAEIAKADDMEFRETGLVGPEELQESDLGKVQFLVNLQTPGGAPRFLPQLVSNQIYRDFDRSRDFDPVAVNELGTFNGYIYWIAEREKDRVPTAEEAKPAIVKYWKRSQAVAMAEAAAQKMADEANSKGQRFTSLYPDDAAPTGEFVWFRPGTQARATYGTPYGVDNAAEEFMTKAFGLKLDEAGVAANETRSIVYAIQRISEPTSIAESGEEYLKEKYFRFKRVPTEVIGGVFVYAQEADDKWNEEFVKSMGYRRVEY